LAYHAERAPAEKDVRNCPRRLGDWPIFRATWEMGKTWERIGQFKQHDSLIQLVEGCRVNVEGSFDECDGVDLLWRTGIYSNFGDNPFFEML